MRPGDRKRRWKESCYVDITIFGFMAGILFVIGLWQIAIVPVLMVILSLRSHHLGWKIDYRLPPHAIRDIKRGDKTGIKAAETVLRFAKDPDRQQYAFEKGKK